MIRRPCPRPVRTAARRATCLIAGAGIVLASGTGPVAAAPAAIPEPLLAQLALGGRLVAPVGTDVQELVVVERTETGFEERRVLYVQFVRS